MKINLTEDRIPYEETKILRTFVNQADAWDMPLVQEVMLELCDRAGIDKNDYEDWDSVEEAIDNALGTKWEPKKYQVKPEYRGLWSNDPEWDGMTDVSEILRLSREWGKSVAELMDQVEEAYEWSGMNEEEDE